MDDKGSWKADLLYLGILVGLCLLVGIHLIRGMVLISRDGAFYISQAQQLAENSVHVARRYPAGYPFVLWIAHGAAARLTGHDSGMLWILSSQGVTLACRVLALVPLYFLGKLLVGARNSFLALLVLIALPYPAQYGSDVLREWPYLLFLSLGLWLLYWGLCRRHWWVLALVGLDAGLGYLIRPECAQLILYGLLGLGCLRWVAGDERHLRTRPRLHARDLTGAKAGMGRAVLGQAGAGVLLLAGFFVPVVPYAYATGTGLLPHQLRSSTGNEPPIISAVGPQMASDEPLNFEVTEEELLEIPVKAFDPQESRLQFSIASAPVGSRPVYEFRSPATENHFWTMAESEKDVLLSMYSRQVWDYVGIACYAYPRADVCPGLRAVHRFWSGVQQRHFYTTDERRKEAILQGPDRTWIYELIAFYAFAAEGHPPDTVAIGTEDAEKDGTPEGRSAPAPSDLRTSWPSAAVAWYAYPGQEPPAGAVIEGGVFRWRPTAGQAGHYQINIIVSDGDLQSCQLIHIKVTAAEDQTTDDGGRTTEDRRQAAEGRAILRLPSSVLCPPSSPPGLGLGPAQAGLGTLPTAVDSLFTAVGEDLMVFFLVPWVMGLYCRLRYLAERLERMLVVALIGVSVALVIGRHFGFGAGEDRRYSLALVALTIFYVPVGLDILAWWLDLVHALWRPRRMARILPHAFWFGLLLVGGLMVCVPNLLASVRADKASYRAAAQWLRQNTKPEDVLVTQDNRIYLYAQRQGLLYAKYPDWRRADHVVVIGDPAQVPAPQGWHREYPATVSPPNAGTVTIYGPDRSP